GADKRPATKLAYSSDGQLLFSCAGYDCLRLWDPSSGEMRREAEFVESATANRVAFSAGGKRLVRVPPADPRRLELLDAETLTPLGKPLEFPADLDELCLSPDGR